MSERRRDDGRDRDESRDRTVVRARRGRERDGDWGDDHTDSELAQISVRIHSRFPDLEDYDHDAHAWKDSYVHASKGYPISVSTPSAVESERDLDRDEVRDVVEEFERERRRRRRPGDGTEMPGDEPPRANVGGRLSVRDEIVSWHWTLEDLDGDVVSRARRSATSGPDAIGAKLVAPALGRYQVKLRLELEDAEQTAAKSIHLRNDRLIVSLGESYASGQGVPDEPSHTNPVWLDPEAYRSLRAGPALAAEAVEDNDDGDLVTYLSFATEGATIEEGLLAPGRAFQDVGQFEAAERAVGDREIDALVLSIGGNDVGFADGLKALALNVFDRDDFREDVQDMVDHRLDELEQTLVDSDVVAERVDALDPEHVLLTEYPIAHFDVAEDGTVGGGCGALTTISDSEARLFKRAAKRLNHIVRAAAHEHGWTFVDGVVEGFRGHGYCSDDPYFVSARRSDRNQGDYRGIVHPNYSGHHVYADRIADALRGGAIPKPPRRRDHRSDDDGERGDGTRRRRRRRRRSSDDSDDGAQQRKRRRRRRRRSDDAGGSGDGRGETGRERRRRRK